MNTPAIESTDHLGDRHYKAIAEIVNSHAGIQLPASKRIMVEGRLRRRVRALGLADLPAYCAYLFEQGGLEDEFDQLIHCVTTNKTDFFREPAHFAFLRDVAVPSLVRDRHKKPVDLKIWSAAASTGAEAYTVAMVLQDMVDNGHPIRYSILGTDISTEVLHTAREGIYESDFVEPVPAALRQRHVLVAADPRGQTVRIASQLRKRVRFQHLNLMDEHYPVDRDIDVIFCRNVLIYFDKPTQIAVASRLVSHLRPGGFLVLGHSESLAGNGTAGVQSVGPTIYQAGPAASRKSAA